ncbi:MAG: serine/threonine protein kinase [Nanoarchaeota archaeon]|nr:serine/threonine protein kinase [Nanoarchaeota archaeon]
MAKLDSTGYKYEDPLILAAENHSLKRYFDQSEREHLTSAQNMGREEDFVARTPIDQMNKQEFGIFLGEVKNIYPLFRERFPVAGHPVEFIGPISSGGFSTIYLGVKSLREYQQKDFSNAFRKYAGVLREQHQKKIEDIINAVKRSQDPKLKLVHLLSKLPLHHRGVAAKVLDTDYNAGSPTHLRFKDEIKILTKIKHPNIVQIIEAPKNYTCDNFQTIFLYVMEYLPDGFDRQKAHPISVVIPVIHAVAKALEAMHNAGVLHRDVKPPNIRVSADGVVKLTDFGLIKKTETYQTQAERSITPKTQSGQVIGSLGFMSPEQASGKEMDLRTDIYSLGTTMWTLLTGEMPYDFETGDDTIVRLFKTVSIKHQKSLEVYADRIFVDAGQKIKPKKSMLKALKWIHRSSTAKEPKKRYSEMALFISDLETILNEL